MGIDMYMDESDENQSVPRVASSSLSRRLGDVAPLNDAQASEIFERLT